MAHDQLILRPSSWARLSAGLVALGLSLASPRIVPAAPPDAKPAAAAEVRQEKVSAWRYRLVRPAVYRTIEVDGNTIALPDVGELLVDPKTGRCVYSLGYEWHGRGDSLRVMKLLGTKTNENPRLLAFGFDGKVCWIANFSPRKGASAATSCKVWEISNPAPADGTAPAWPRVWLEYATIHELLAGIECSHWDEKHLTGALSKSPAAVRIADEIALAASLGSRAADEWKWRAGCNHFEVTLPAAISERLKKRFVAAVDHQDAAIAQLHWQLIPPGSEGFRDAGPKMHSYDAIRDPGPMDVLNDVFGYLAYSDKETEVIRADSIGRELPQD